MSDRDPPEKQSPDSASEALLKAALEVVAQHGLKGATTRLIAQHAGVNEVTLFRHYGHKNGLIKAAVLSRASTLRQQGVQYTGNLEHDLIHLVTEYQRVLAHFGPFLRVMLTEFPRHPELQDVISAGPAPLFRDSGDLLARYQDEGLLRPEPLSTLLPALLAPVVMPFLVPKGVPALLNTSFTAPEPRTHVRLFLQGRGLTPLEDS